MGELLDRAWCAQVGDAAVDEDVPALYPAEERAAAGGHEHVIVFLLRLVEVPVPARAAHVGHLEPVAARDQRVHDHPARLMASTDLQAAAGGAATC
jgi:hypothetical protein